MHVYILTNVDMQEAYDPDNTELADEDVSAIMDALRTGNDDGDEEEETDESKRMLYEAPEWRQEI